jgi:hypothetical protein
VISHTTFKQRIIATTLVFVSLILFSFMPALKAQEDDPDVDVNVEYTFGEELRFILVAENAADVEQLRLEFRPEFAAELYTVDVPFEAGETLSVTYPVDVTLIHLRPFSELTYSWHLATSEGSSSVPEQSITYEDDRFQWSQSAREAATVHWTGNGPSFGSDALNVVDDALGDLVSVLPLASVNKFDVYVYPSSADLRTGLEAAGLDGEETTNPELGVMFVTAVNPQSAVTDLGQSIPYELAHLLLYQASGDQYDSFPWWLSEGLGTLFQSRPDPSYEIVLDEAVQTDSTLALWQLCRSPGVTGVLDGLARAQSASITAYILERYGDQKVSELVQSHIEGNDCETGVQRTLGMSLDQLEAAWLGGYGGPTPLEQFFVNYGLWLLLLLAGFSAALLIIRFSTRGGS